MDAAELTADKPRTIKMHGKQIVLFRVGSEEIQAIDNRCPHEGYPLSTGMLKDGVLTCEWHNWKFRLCDGKCVLGGEDVRHYPLRIEEGSIWLDLEDPPVERAVPRLYAALADAFNEGDWGQAGRAVERLLQAGQTPAQVLGFGCDFAATHAPYGFDHGLAAAADLAALLPEFADEPGVPLLQALSLMVEPNLRRPERTLAMAEAVHAQGAEDAASPAARALEADFRGRVESEDLAGAEAMIRGAMVQGMSPDVLLAWITHAATDHFLGFGHSQIYCVKAEELLDVIGWEHAHPVLTSLVSSIVLETREDRLPYMREHKRIMTAYEPRLEEWARMPPAPHARLDIDAIMAAVLDGELESALGAVAAALDRGVAPDRVALALGLCAAHRLMRFDARLEHDDSVAEDWLNITHSLTHADAVRESLVRRPSAALLRGLFHSARFVQHLGVCDLAGQERPRIAGAAPDPDAPDRGLLGALIGHDAAGAMAAARLCAGAGLGRGTPLRTSLVRAVVSDRASIPIFVAHHIKTTMAALRLTQAAVDDPELSRHADRDLPIVAAVRFLAHPLQERRVSRRARVSRVFVREGRMQNKLLGY